MKIIMVAAISKDGFIADENGSVTSWTSKEEQTFFADIRSQHDFFVMGSGTFDAKPKKATPDTLRVILTRRPEDYAVREVPGQLEFHNLTPLEVVDTYGDRFKTCLLLGGGHVYQAFLEQNLVDELYLTREPASLGSGTSLLAAGSLDLSLFRLVSAEALNAEGTTLEHYELKK